MPFLNFDTTASRKEISEIVKQFESCEEPSSTAAEAAQHSEVQPDSDNFFHSGRDKKQEGKGEKKHPAKPPVDRRVSQSETFFLGRDGANVYPLAGGGHPRRRTPGSKMRPRPDFKELNSTHVMSDAKMTTMNSTSHLEKYRMLIREYLSHRHGAIHLSRTLDQFYYNSIGTANRDQDQVVYRFSRNHQTPMMVKPEIVDSYHQDSFAEDIEVASESEDRLQTGDSTRDNQNSGAGFLSKFRDAEEGGLRPISSKQKVEEEMAYAHTENPRIFTVDQM